MNEIKLSVIIPMFNSEYTIEACLDSIFDYSTKNMEIILINDGSTDKTLKVCEPYINKHDNIKLISYEENKGVGNARNVGLENSKGKYISFIDSDDYIKDNMLNRMVNTIEETNVDIVMCEFEQILLDGRISKHKFKFYENIGEGTLVKENIINFLNLNTNGSYGYLYAKLYRKSLFIENNINFTLDYCEDMIANYIILKKVNSIYLLHKVLYINRVVRDSICSQIINPKIVNDKRLALININETMNSKVLNNLFIEDFMVGFLVCYQSSIFQTKIYNQEFNQNQKFILFGASNLGKQYMMMLERYDYYNILFVDNDKNKQNTYIRNHKIISIDELKEIKKDTDFLIISSQYFVPILKQLLDNKIIHNVSEVLISKDNTKMKNALIDFFETILSISNQHS